MKTRILTLLLISFFYCLNASGQSSAGKADPAGMWKFDAPYAPEGYTSGTVEVKFADKKYSVSMVFTGSEYKFPGEKVKFEKDSLFFLIYVEGQDVNVSLKLENDTKMTGKAVYSEGEVPLTLTKNTDTGKK